MIFLLKQKNKTLVYLFKYKEQNEKNYLQIGMLLNYNSKGNNRN